MNLLKRTHEEKETKMLEHEKSLSLLRASPLQETRAGRNNLNKFRIWYDYDYKDLVTPGQKYSLNHWDQSQINCSCQFQPLFTRTLGMRQYSISDHLSNVLATVLDRKIGVPMSGSSTNLLSYYKADIATAQDYYPFGMPMPGRTYQAPQPLSGYRFGYGYHENINQLYGTANIVDMGDRLLDVRLGRTHKQDKKADKYPSISPYSFALNNPNFFKDDDGNIVVDMYGHPVTVIVTDGGTINAKACFEFAAGTNQRAIDEFNANAGKVISNLIQTPTGFQQVTKVIETSDKVQTKVYSLSQVPKPITDKQGEVTLGETGLRTVPIYDNNEKVTSEQEAILRVSIYESSILQAGKDARNPELLQDPNSPGTQFEDNNLTTDQREASTAGHEYEHATNPEHVKLLKEHKTMERTDPRHKAAYDKGAQISNEFGKNNRK